MAFKLTPNPTFKLPIRVPGGSTGRLTLTVKHKTREELNEWYEAGKSRKDFEQVADIVTDWDGDTAFTPEELEKFLANFPGSAMVIYREYAAEFSGAERKN